MSVEVFMLEFMFIIAFDPQRWSCDLNVTLWWLKLHGVYGWGHTRGSSSSFNPYLPFHSNNIITQAFIKLICKVYLKKNRYGVNYICSLLICYCIWLQFSFKVLNFTFWHTQERLKTVFAQRKCIKLIFITFRSTIVQSKTGNGPMVISLQRVVIL